jgi:hypothetical protein
LLARVLLAEKLDLDDLQLLFQDYDLFLEDRDFLTEDFNLLLQKYLAGLLVLVMMMGARMLMSITGGARGAGVLVLGWIRIILCHAVSPVSAPGGIPGLHYENEMR